MKKNWHIVNSQPNKDNPTLTDGQICKDQLVGSPAINFYASDCKLLTRLLADAEVGSRMVEIITSKEEGQEIIKEMGE